MLCCAEPALLRLLPGREGEDEGEDEFLGCCWGGRERMRSWEPHLTAEPNRAFPEPLPGRAHLSKSFPTSRASHCHPT